MIRPTCSVALPRSHDRREWDLPCRFSDLIVGEPMLLDDARQNELIPTKTRRVRALASQLEHRAANERSVGSRNSNAPSLGMWNGGCT